jgi:hypothetical protein
MNLKGSRGLSLGEGRHLTTIRDHLETEKQMGKISLDGVMQSPGPTDVPFKHRGWAVDFDGSREGARFN